MPRREIVIKTIAFGVVSLALIAGGIFVLTGSHVTGDVLDPVLGILLILMGLGVGGLGSLAILGWLLDQRARRRQTELHITPRGGAPALPPAWGMGEVGRPGSGVIAVGDGGRHLGGGTAKTVALSISNVDVPLGIAYLLLWTAVGLVSPVFLWALAAVTVVVGGGVVSMSWLLKRKR